MPRLTTGARTALGTTLISENNALNDGMQVYDTDTKQIFYWNETTDTWQAVSTGSGSDVTTASNGLTEVGDDVRLGGTLNQNTSIDQNGYNLTYLNTGFVGIGQATPAAKLHINGGNWNTSLRITNTNDAQVGAGILLEGANRSYAITATNSGAPGGGQKLGIWDDVASTHRFSIDQTGNVAVGAGNPAYKLDVEGTIRSGSNGFDGQLRLYSEQGTTDYEATFSPNPAMTGNTDYVLPADHGVGFLFNAGGGALSWVAPTGESTTASNGLTEVGDDVRLGGTLTGLTEIVQAGNDFAFTGGRVGINTTSPVTILDALGTNNNAIIRATNTSTSALAAGVLGQNNANGPVAGVMGFSASSNSNAAGVVASANNVASSLKVERIGGTGLVAQFIGSFATTVVNNSGFVGIGSPTPSTLFTVGSLNQFTVNTSGNLTRINNVPYSWPAANNNGILTNDGSGNLNWTSGPGLFIQNQVAANQTGGFRVGGNGFIGGTSYLGTTTGTARLNVNGDIGLSSGAARNIFVEDFGGGNGNDLSVSAGNSTAIDGDGGRLLLTGGSATAGSVSPHGGNAFLVGGAPFGPGNPGNVILAHTGSAPRGNVGIGDPTPQSLLTVGNGDRFQVDSNGNIVRINNVITNFPSTQGAASSVLTNDGSGNLTWAAPSGAFIQNQNAVLQTADFRISGFADANAYRVDGNTVLKANGSTTISVGNFAGNFNNENTFVGYTAGQNMSSGNANAVFGAYAGLNGTGSFNTYIGVSTNYDGGNGNGNTYLGYEAGYTDFDGNNNTLLGRRAELLSNGLSNATAIGYNAKVNASNSLILGGTGSEQVSVGIGTTAPEAYLDIVGSGSGSYLGGLPALLRLNGTDQNLYSIIFSNQAAGVARDWGIWMSNSGELMFENDPGAGFETALSLNPNGTTRIWDNAIFERDLELTSTSNIVIGGNPGSTGDVLSIDGSGNMVWSAAGGSDDLGNHLMTQNLTTDGNWISGDNDNEGLFVNLDGDVGINQSTINDIFHINDKANSQGSLRLTAGTTTGTTTTDGLAISINSTAANILNYENTSLHLGTNGANRLSVSNTGNVGIGTSSPAYKLDVVGDINVPLTGKLYIGGTSGTSGQVLSINGSGNMEWMNPGAGSYIENQTALAQTADFRIDGNGAIGNSLAIGKASSALASSPAKLEIHSGATSGLDNFDATAIVFARTNDGGSAIQGIANTTGDISSPPWAYGGLGAFEVTPYTGSESDIGVYGWSSEGIDSWGGFFGIGGSDLSNSTRWVGLGGMDNRTAVFMGGHVGIGTVNPEGLLDTYGDFNIATEQQAVMADQGSGLYGFPYGSDKPNLIVSRGHGGSQSGASGELGYVSSMIDFRGNDGFSNEASLGQIIGTVDANGGGSWSGSLLFATSPGGGFDPAGRRTTGWTPVVRMMLDHNGRLGIGTAMPATTLDVRSLASGQETVARFGISDAGNERLLIENSTGTDSQFNPRLSAQIEDANDSGSNPILTLGASTTSGSVANRPLIGFQNNGGTFARFEPNGDLHIEGRDVLFSQFGDKYHGIGLYDSYVARDWGGTPVNGPMVYGFDGGALGWYDNAPSKGISLRWKSNGNVGIGTINPNYRLDVNGVINTATGYRVGNTAAIAGTYLRGNGTNFVMDAIAHADLPLTAQHWQRVGTNVTLINVGDNVGIGLTNPTKSLVIEKQGTYAEVNVHTYGGITSSDAYSAFVLGRARGTQATPTASQANDVLGALMFRGHYGGAGNWQAAASQIRADAAETFSSATNAGSRLIFSTVPIGTASPQPRVTIDHNGNVAIGNITPTGLFDVYKAGADLDMYHTVENNNGFGARTLVRKARQTAGLPSNVALGDKIMEQTAWGYGGGAYRPAAQMQMEVDQAGTVSGTSMPGRISFWTTPNLSVAMVRRMVIERNGYVGIGILNPAYPLDVSLTLDGQNFAAAAPTRFTTITSVNTNTLTNNTVLNGVSVSIRSVGYVLSGVGFVMSSDQRIKQIQQRSDTEQDLATLQKLQVTDYTYRDTIEQGTAAVKGFIAQEVESVYPQAVSKQRNWIPDIYQLATQTQYDAGKQTLTLQLSKNHELKVGDKVKLYTPESEEIRLVTEVNGQSFTVGDWKKQEDKVFVYGREVNDFRVIDYDRLFTLGVSAIQELAKRNEALTQTVGELRAELETARTEALKTKDENAQIRSTLDQILQRLEKVEAVTGTQAQR
jgi:hypothetical protein